MKATCVGLLTAMLLVMGVRTAEAQADGAGNDVRAVAIILDCSGSMAEPTTDQEPKMAAAKRVVASLLEKLPADLDVAFAVYGHNAELDCEAVKVVRPLAPLDDSGRQDLRSYVRALRPVGKTPIALALRTIGADLARSSKRSQIILVTDGMETCGGDPAGEAARLMKTLNLKSVEVVGVGVSQAEFDGVKAIAEAGKGAFVNARNAKDLATAFEKALPITGPIKVDPPSIVVKRTVVSAIVVQAPPKEFGKITGVKVYEAGADLKERGVKPVQYSDQAGDPLVVQPGAYDVYVHGWLQSEFRIASGLVVAKNQTVTLAARGLLAGIVVKELGIPGVKVGSIDAVKKGRPDEPRNKIQSVDRLGQVMLVPPDVPLDVYLTPWLAKPMLLETVTPKAGELTIIGGDGAEQKTSGSSQETTSNAASAPGVVVVLTPGLSDPPTPFGVRSDATPETNAAAGGNDPKDEVARLIRVFENGSMPERVEAAEQLGRFGPQARAAIPALSKLVGHQRPTKTEGMAAALSVVGAMRPDAARVAAVKALYKIDKAEAIKALESATQCSHPGVRVWATKTLENATGEKGAPAAQPTSPPKRFKEPVGRFKEPTGRFKQ